MEASEAKVLRPRVRRRTVRTFDGTPLSPETCELLETLASNGESLWHTG